MDYFSNKHEAIYGSYEIFFNKTFFLHKSSEIPTAEANCLNVISDSIENEFRLSSWK